MSRPPQRSSQPLGLVPPGSPAVGSGAVSVSDCAVRIDANGTMWRLRSLIAMGHDGARLAAALGESPDVMRRIIRGQTRTITPQLRAITRQLWNAWWDKTPPRRTTAERSAASRALALARARNWPAPAALDEDQLDQPGYRPYSRYLPGTGTGTAPSFHPAPLQTPPRTPRPGTAARPRPPKETDHARREP
jgi:hypothetical protein